MRIVRYLLILPFILFAGYCSIWYYIANEMTSEINTKYAGQKIFIKALVNSEDYFVTFDKASMSGFPFDIAVGLHGWKEESRGSLISYNSPIKIGYSFRSQAAYVSYDGDIDSAYKPVEGGFGAILKIRDYLIKIDIPLTKALITSVGQMKDSVELVNYIKDINISTKEVQIIDKQEKELFSDKEYERLSFSFVPAKYYQHLQDLLSDIPKEYKINYSVRTKPVQFLPRPIPISLFYGFLDLPSNFSASGNMAIKTKAKTAEELFSNLEAQLELVFSAPTIDLTSLKLEFKIDPDPIKGRNIALLVDSKITLKDGLFEELFKKYESIRPRLLAVPGGQLINQEVVYIINNKDVFGFKDLENSDYLLNVDITSLDNKNTSLIKLNNFSIYSGESGFKLTHESTIKLINKNNWNQKGVWLIKNYPAVVDFSSAYIYRFGKFRFLNDQARVLYADVNKAFLKQISDYPASTSNDLSFDYDINLQDWSEAKIGSTKIAQIPDLYQLMLYRKLFDVIDLHGDTLVQIKKLLPDLDENEPIFKKLLSQIMGKDIKKLLPDTMKKVLPNEYKKCYRRSSPNKRAAKLAYYESYLRKLYLVLDYSNL